MKFLESRQSGILNGGKGLFTIKKLKALEPIGWYEGDVHSAEDCVDSSYCASLNGVHVDPRKQFGYMLRYANDAYRNKHMKNNAKMEFILRRCGGGVIPWPFLYARIDIEPGEEILYSYGDKYWRKRKQLF